ncbi:MAG: hypothetical protein K6U74_02430 [Firmicutes bacterium]|nr:hypothetical protein [Bacillota bacterium]
MQLYAIWASHTCWVCRKSLGSPRLHASARGYRPTSPCDSAVATIKAESREEALKEARRRFKKFL